MITKSSIESANPSSSAREDRRRDQRQRHLPEGRPLVGAEVHRGFLEMPVEADQPRLHGHDRVADDEHDVRDRDREEAGRDLQLQEERQQRGAEHDLGRGHRHEDEQVGSSPPVEAVTDERERDQGPESRRHDARDRRDLDGEHHRVREAGHSVPVDPVVEGEALPRVVEAPRRVVERERDHNRDREQQVDERAHRVAVSAWSARGARIAAVIRVSFSVPERPARRSRRGR